MNFIYEKVKLFDIKDLLLSDPIDSLQGTECNSISPVILRGETTLTGYKK